MEIWRVTGWEGEVENCRERYRDEEANIGRYRIVRGMLRTV